MRFCVVGLIGTRRTRKGESMEILGFVVLILFVVFLAWAFSGKSREERIEEAMQYDPDPVHGVARFATPDELRKRGW